MWDEVWEITSDDAVVAARPAPGGGVATPPPSPMGPPVDPSPVDPSPPSPDLTLEQVLAEMAEMRREHARRSTMQLIVTCGLFALLMHHLDRPRIPRG
jgi:hypothetical protein